MRSNCDFRKQTWHNWSNWIIKRRRAIKQDWSKIDKDEYLNAMIISPLDDKSIKELIKDSLTDKINDRELYMKGIDHSYFYEGYKEYRTEDL